MIGSVALKLGRVSNLPTVWTNMLAGIMLAGGTVIDSRTLPLMLALSMFYIGGMYLNDAFDAEIDAIERPERPIPSGQVSRETVYRLGFAMLGTGMCILLLLGFIPAQGTGWWSPLAGIALVGAIIFYNWHHKNNPLSPLVMGLCRVLVYITAGLCLVVPAGAHLLVGAALLMCYLIGLTYVAKQENLEKVQNLWPLVFLAAPVIYGANLMVEQPIVGLFWIVFAGWIGIALWLVKRRRPGDIPRAVVSLIAGISLLDAMLIAATGHFSLAGLAVLGFVLTLLLQRFIPGT